MRPQRVTFRQRLRVCHIDGGAKQVVRNVQRCLELIWALASTERDRPVARMSSPDAISDPRPTLMNTASLGSRAAAESVSRPALRLMAHPACADLADTWSWQYLANCTPRRLRRA